jgi:DNA-binding NtrC family response regulator
MSEGPRNANTTSSAATSASASQPIRVLVVDDDPQAAALLEPALHDAPFEVQVETAPNYTIGLRRIQANEHDIYLIDYRLPDGTGTALIHEAKAAGVEKPFILITGNGNGRVDEVALSEGAADYIEKDQLEKYLSRSIRYALRDWE